MTAQAFSQTPSELLEIRDWSVARELDVEAALYLYREQMKREIEREKRDREFWITMFGGKNAEDVDVNMSLEEAIARSPLGK